MYAMVTLAVLTALVCAFNTANLVAVNRRLRYLGELLWQVEQRGVPAKAPPAGSPVGPFAVQDTDGGAVTSTGWEDRTLVAFMDPACLSCRQLRRELRPLAARWPAGRRNVVVVLTGPSARADFARRLAPVARVVVDQQETVRAAFGVEGLPAIFVVEPPGVLSWTGMHPDTVPAVTEPAQ
ncbi:hypothetical protein AB0C07_22510 [Actinoplanes missouriensis]|uniref:TlpA family protein disulfide reductase n=1 Tax=Actinoplanes missouriensis TaxID=1866 RepID=UPI0034115706